MDTRIALASSKSEERLRAFQFVDEQNESATTNAISGVPMLQAPRSHERTLDSDPSDDPRDRDSRAPLETDTRSKNVSASVIRKPALESQGAYENNSASNIGDSNSSSTLADGQRAHAAVNTSIDSFIRTSREYHHETDGQISASIQLPQLIGRDVFRKVLQDPDAAHQLLLFCQSERCGENMEFLEKVTYYQSLVKKAADVLSDVHNTYISVDAPSQVNIAENLRRSTYKRLESAFTSALPELQAVLEDARRDIERLVACGVYPRFVRHQISLSAAKALANNRAKYAGLGDCFVLTSPSKPDNPIVYASDGFVKVTGYTRKEIIPRNCRFLQGQYTEQDSVRRIKKSIADRKESVELLLNYRKTHEPFWNLLYTAPLFDTDGNIVFFIGGQINCSTTIKNSSDAVRILSVSRDTDESTKKGLTSGRSREGPKSGGILRALRSPMKPQVALRQTGIEQDLLDNIENLDLEEQATAFYSAYSRYFVINYSTFLIAFYSAAAATLFYPHKPLSSTQLIGADIFQILKQQALPESWKGLRDRTKNALKAGRSVSIDVELSTRRSAGFEKFTTHWTPLKDEHGKVGFIILMLGSNKL